MRIVMTPNITRCRPSTYDPRTRYPAPVRGSAQMARTTSSSSASTIQWGTVGRACRAREAPTSLLETPCALHGRTGTRLYSCLLVQGDEELRLGPAIEIGGDGGHQGERRPGQEAGRIEIAPARARGVRSRRTSAPSAPSRDRAVRRQP